MEALERYLEAVGRHLRGARREDIVAELRANLEAQLDDKQAELGRPLTAQEMEDWLKQLGAPLQMAARGMEIDENTLYPLLRRLEAQGLLTSEWREEEKRNKRFYRLSAEGAPVLELLLAEWQSLNAAIETIRQQGKGE